MGKDDTIIYITVGVACLLLVLSLVQTVQIGTLDIVRTDNVVRAQDGQAQPVAASPPSAPPPAPAAQPTMVGGC